MTVLQEEFWEDDIELSSITALGKPSGGTHKHSMNKRTSALAVGFEKEHLRLLVSGLFGCTSVLII